MNRDVEQNGVLKTCEELGIGFVPWGPLGQGYGRPPQADLRQTALDRGCTIPAQDQRDDRLRSFVPELLSQITNARLNR